MNSQATAKFQLKSWDEKTFEEIGSGAKLTRASVSFGYQGDIEGSSKVEYLMAYREDGTGDFVGLERIVGRVGDRTGSFILQHNGTFGSEGVKVKINVMPGSGTENLRGLRGEGEAFLPSHKEDYPLTLNYYFE
jgi:hypothetical protein